MNADQIFCFACVVIVAAACFYSGYQAGRATIEAQYGRYYRELCARLIEAIKGLKND